VPLDLKEQLELAQLAPLVKLEKLVNPVPLDLKEQLELAQLAPLVKLAMQEPQDQTVQQG
jgi:hypothetical protein